MFRFNKFPTSWFIFLLALAVRLAYLATTADLFSLNPFLFGDAYHFDREALRNLFHFSLNDASTYSLFLSLCYQIFGAVIFFPKLIQCLLGSLTCVLIYKIGKRTWNKKTGVVSGLLAVFYGIFLFYDGALLKPSIGNFLFALTLYLLVLNLKKIRWLPSLAALVTLLGAVSFREHLIFAVPAAALWFFYLAAKARSSKALTLGSLFLFIVLAPFLVLIPPLQPHLPQSQIPEISGLHFYIGNQPLGNGTYAPIPGIPNTAEGHYRRARQVAERESGRPISSFEANSFWFKKGFRFIAAEPARWLKIEAAKVFLIFNTFEIPHDGNYPFARKNSKFLSFPFLSYGIICPLGLMGLLLSFRRIERGPLLLILLFFFYLLSLLLTFVTANFRLPLELIVILLAGFGIMELIKMLKEKRALRFILCLAGSGVLYWFVNYPTYLPKNGYDNNTRKDISYYSVLNQQRPRLRPIGLKKPISALQKTAHYSRQHDELI